MTNGLGFLPYANGVHYDSEAQRRHLLHKLMLDGTLSPLAYATDDHAGIWYEGTEPTGVVSDTPVDPESGSGAYRVELVPGETIETRVGSGHQFD